MMNKVASPAHLVVVDDDIEIQDLVKAFFSTRGFQVSTFGDAESAYDDCSKNGETWDVLLTDLHLPRMSGPALIEKIKRLRPELPIILITVSKSAETAVEAIRNGAYDFIVKPLYFPQLLISVERALHLNALNGNLNQLRERVRTATSVGSHGIVGKSPKFLAALEVARRVARSSANIFISGESGTGKELFARYIHNQSQRSRGPFIAINCSAIPENLLESELFGHAKGAFTGAQDKKPGLFEEAQDGTLFLDEIGDLSPNMQAKLLRVLQEKKIKRVGENQFRSMNARIISATHKNLSYEIHNGQFREDLFYRLSVIPLIIPSLRERVDDILPLAESFLRRFAVENKSMARSFSKDAIKYMLENPWRGNVRELENAIERAVVLATEAEVKRSDFVPSLIDDSPLSEPNGERYSNQFTLPFQGRLPTLEEITKKYIEFAVSYNDGARDRTAKEIGIDRKTLYKRLRTNDQQRSSQH